MVRRTRLARLTDACVVQVEQGQARGGSGFWVAPGMVITCAHVVSGPAEAGFAQPDKVAVRWEGQVYEGAVRAVPDRPGGRLWAYPDLALITLAEPPPGHPYVPLGGEFPEDTSELYAVGFKKTFAGPGGPPELGGVWVRYDAPQGFQGRRVLMVTGRELASGMSGGPVMDPSRGVVCGILKTARREGSPEGGLVTSAAAIEECFPEAWAANQNPGLQWDDAPVPPADDFAGLRAAEGLDLYALFSKVFDGLRPFPAQRLETLDDLVDEVADSMPTEHGEHPLTRLRAALAAAAPAPAAAQGPALIEVRLVNCGSNRTRFTLAAWLYRSLDGPPCMLFCDDLPRTISAIRREIRAVIRDALGELSDAEELLVEFVVPRQLLGKDHENVDEWYIDQKWAPLGTQFPLLLRTLDRPPQGRPPWHRRWGRLHAGDADPALLWVNCHSDYSPERLYGSFLDEEHAILAVSYLPKSGAVRKVLAAAFEAGVPVALWPRQLCAEHATGQPIADICQGDRFQRDLTQWLAGKSLRDLPYLVKQLRTEALKHGPEHCGRGLSLLWDDPTRKDPDDYALAEPQGAVP